MPAPHDHPRSLYAVDGSGRIVFCTDDFARLVGERAEDVVGKLSLTYYPADDAPSLLMQRVDAMLHDGRSVVRKTRLRRTGDGTLPVELSVLSLGEGHGAGHLVRVTELGASANGAGTAAPQGVLEDLVSLSGEEADALPYGLIILNDEGFVLRYNAAESRLSRLRPERVIGRQFFEQIAPCTRVKGLGSRYRRMVETGEPESTQLDFVFPFQHGERRVFIVMAYVRAMREGVLLIDPY